MAGPADAGVEGLEPADPSTARRIEVEEIDHLYWLSAHQPAQLSTCRVIASGHGRTRLSRLRGTPGGTRRTPRAGRRPDRKLNEALRADLRHAAPFGEGPPTFQPPPPAASPANIMARRPSPAPSELIHERHEAEFPGDCPHFDGPRGETGTAEQFQTEILRTPSTADSPCIRVQSGWPASMCSDFEHPPK
jgi:hypothetical protein